MPPQTNWLRAYLNHQVVHTMGSTAVCRIHTHYLVIFAPYMPKLKKQVISAFYGMHKTTIVKKFDSLFRL